MASAKLALENPSSFQAVAQFMSGQDSKKLGHNTSMRARTEPHPETGINYVSHFAVYLHGNCIARFYPEYAEFQLAGWNSPTTRGRLNKLVPNPFANGFCQKKHEPYFVYKNAKFELENNQISDYDTVRLNYVGMLLGIAEKV